MRGAIITKSHMRKRMRLFPFRAAWSAALLLSISLLTARAERPNTSALTKTNKAAIVAISPATIRHQMEILSSDKMEGRDAGSKGYQMAAKYAADQFKR